MRLIDTVGAPPPDALHATQVAADVARDLLDAGREVRFVVVPTRDRVAVSLCDDDGAILSRLSPARVLEIAAGGRAA